MTNKEEKSTISKLADAAGEILGGAGDVIEDVVDGVVDTAEDVIDNIAETVDDVVEEVKETKKKVKMAMKKKSPYAMNKVGDVWVVTKGGRKVYQNPLEENAKRFIEARP